MHAPASLLFIAPRLGLSGATERLRCCVTALVEGGVRVSVAAAGGSRRDDFAAAGAEVIGWQSEIRPWRLPFVARRMGRLACSLEVDFVHLLGQELAPLGARMGVDYLLELSTPLSAPLPHNPDHLRAVLSPCSTLEEGFVNRGGLPRDKMQQIPHQPEWPVDRAKSFKRPGARRVGCASGFHSGSGVEVFLLAARKLIQRGENAHFIVLGEGPCEAQARRCARDLGLLDRVIFASPAAPSTAEILSELDVFVDPRVAGAPGWLAHEALALGVPSIISAVRGSFSLVTDQEDALLVARNEPEALTGCIADLLGDESWARQLGTRARKNAKRRIAQATAPWLDLYQDSPRTISKAQ